MGAMVGSKLVVDGGSNMVHDSWSTGSSKMVSMCWMAVSKMEENCGGGPSGGGPSCGGGPGGGGKPPWGSKMVCRVLENSSSNSGG